MRIQSIEGLTGHIERQVFCHFCKVIYIHLAPLCCSDYCFALVSASIADFLFTCCQAITRVERDEEGEVAFRQFPCRQLPFRQLPLCQFPFRQPRRKKGKFRSHFANFPMLFLVILSVSVNLSVSQFFVLSCSLRNLKSHLVRTQSLNVLPLKPGVGQHIAIYATLTARDFFLAYFHPSDPHLHFFKNPFKFFLCWLWLTHGSCASPQNKIGHPVECRFPC